MKRRELIKTGILASVASILPLRAKSAEICDNTTSDIEGPFYTPNAPVKHVLSPVNAPGTPVYLTGTVYANDCITPVPNALLDVWHAGHNGEYDNNGFNYRGFFDADQAGNYAFQSILPGKYLNGSYYRPRHIHFKIQGITGKELTTQLYFEGDTSIPDDPWASNENAENRTIPLQEDNMGNLHGVFDIFLDISSEDITNINVHGNNRSHGRILSVSPNPVQLNSEIYFYLATRSNACFHVYDLYGRLIKGTKPQYLSGGGILSTGINNLNKFGIKISSGLYIVQMLIDNIPVDAKRIIVK